ncbi:MAG: phosphodiester glycosidase family protein, partial [Bacillota bacterium]|nr:phosphodiester glycosidase family protein [Bacillota bacterium]
MRKQAGVFQKLAARLGMWTLAFGLVLTTSLSSNAEYRIIHSESVQYTDIAPGVRHELHQFFTEEGWIVVNVVRSKQDASDSVVPLYTKGDLTSPRTLSEFVKNEKNVVAAINGDYYDYKSEAVLGRLMDRGALVQTSNRDKKHAHVEIGRDGKIAIGYEDGSSVRLLYGGNQRDVAFVNKRYTDWDNILLFDRAFGAKSPGFGDLRGEGDKTPVVEYRVEKGNVVQMIRNDEEDANGAKETESVDQLDIPEGGLAEGNFIIRAQGKYAEDMVSTLKVGDTVELLLPKMPYTSISGGAQLVKDGKVVEAFTHNVYGEHPRTAIGVEKDGKTVLFVTVNGRSSSYRGIRQSELAELMVKLGAYQALILD